MYLVIGYFFIFFNGSWGEGGSKIANTMEAALKLIILTLEARGGGTAIYGLYRYVPR